MSAGVGREPGPFGCMLPAECLLLYVKYPLSLRNVEDTPIASGSAAELLLRPVAEPFL